MNTSHVDDATCESTAISREDMLLCIAKQLCEAREKADISIDTVAVALKLRKVYLQALETGDWSDMPGEVYALGFLKQYADYLGLNLSESIEKLKSGQYQFTKPLTFPDPPIAPAKTWVLAAALAFIIIFIIFNIFDQSPAPLPSQLMKNQAEKTLQQQVPSKQADVLYQESVEKDAQDKAQDTINTSITNTSNITPGVQAISSYRYQLKAVNDDVWLQLHETGEPPVLVREALLKKGDTMTLTHSTPLLLDSGNSLALEVILNGKVIIHAGTLGKKDKVLHGYLLQQGKNKP